MKRAIRKNFTQKNDYKGEFSRYAYGQAILQLKNKL